MKDEQIFEKAFEKAELSKYNHLEYESYERSLMEYRDLKGYIDTAFDDGALNRAMQIAAIMKQEGELVDKIIQYTGLTKEEIAKL